MTIKRKIQMILLGGWVFITLTGIFGLIGMRDSNQGIRRIYQENMAISQKIGRVSELMRNNRILLLLALQHDPANPEILKLHDHDLTVHTDLVVKNTEEIASIWKEVTAAKMDSEEQKLAADFAAKWETFVKEGLNPVREAILAGKFAEATALTLTKLNPLFKPADAAATLIKEYEGNDTQKFYNQAMHHYQMTMGLVIGLVIIAIIGSGLVGLLVIRSLSAGTRALIDASSSLAQGDLTGRLRLSGKDELGAIGRSFDSMADSLSAIISKITATVADVTASAAEVHANSKEMAEGANQVAAQAGAVATAGEEMAATSGDIARNCQMAADGARLVSDEASKGSGIIQNSIQVMGRISERVSATATTVENLGQRSDQIGQIIGTIEDIADQTNLLALNAAIEAARAGEQGRGFAVVADEVRALAERTTKATREIGEMIKAIQSETKQAVSAMEEGVSEVERGTHEAGRSGDAMNAILDQINNLSLQVSQIATAAEQQTATTSEISKSIIEITDVSNQTSNNAHQSASEGNKLNTLAESLTTMLADITIEESISLCLRKAKSAHMIFTGKIKSHLDGNLRLDPNALPTHLTCAFGKWYQSKGQEKCGQVGIFREISAPHAKVHELGKQAIAAYNSGDRNAAEQYCQEMVTQSQRLISMLEQLERECK